jgi:ABC-2 type transport system ATP-binding protein
MEPPALIEINGLTKTYETRTVVKDVSFRCEPGTVTGFLGPNGAGKSTTLKMLCGLVRPSAGHAQVLGQPYASLANPGLRVGILIDAAAQHAGRRGAEALSIAAQTLRVPRTRVAEMLALVGLDDVAGRRRIGQYSLGMRQRLGIALALLGDPEVLVLDEPANGLDPEGIRWMRELLRGFAGRGGTVLLSSHLLNEVEAVADRLVVIASGEIVATGTSQELRGENVAGSAVKLADGAEQAELLCQELTRSGVVFRSSDDGGLLVEAPAAEVGRAALRAGVAISSLGPVSVGASLEQVFLELTGSSNGKEENR